MGKLFGTDGIRGVANHYPMTVDVAMAMGRAVAYFVRQQGGSSAIIGRDTRRSGTMLEAALTAGLAAEGIDVYLAGVIPTPGVAFLVSHTPGAGAGIVISASHNPYQDNGIKLFDSRGYKLLDQEEATMESTLMTLLFGVNRETQPSASFGEPASPRTIPPEPGLISPMVQGREKYITFLQKCFSIEDAHRSRLTPIVVDCSNGAACQVAEAVFSGLGLECHFIHNDPNGRNINENCGSQHTGDLFKAVSVHGARVGLAFDGDADRLIALDENGDAVTGDKILAICACHAASRSELPNNRVVSTVMSNIGLGIALTEHGIHHEVTGVGDRLVMAAMGKTGAVMGGEDSGHMIFSQYHTTGDGILTALRLLSVMAETGKTLSQLASVMTVYPQVLKNVEINPDRPDFKSVKSIHQAIESMENLLGERGRVLVRYSGTQPLLRVMIEGPDQLQIEKACDHICSVISSEIGC